jgi:proteasome lid subunit RPN8/RPN11
VKLEIPSPLIEKILSAAARAYPKECCGLIEGKRDQTGWRALALHDTENLAVNSEREFLIDPEAHFRLLRKLRGTSRDVIGCYHSHPDGKPAPSQRDREGGGEDGFLWLIAASGQENSLRAFVYESGGFREVQLNEKALPVAQPE